MKNIAIFAANGFVGKNLKEHLLGKHNVYSITRKDFDLLDEDKVKNFFDSYEVDVVIHCGNQGGARKDGYDNGSKDIIGNNLKMFFNIERAISDKTKMINFGSGAQYNKARDLDKVFESEIGNIIPKDDYGYSKYLISKYINNINYKKIYNPIIFGLFGKYEDYSYKFISNAIIKNILHMPIIINQNVVFDYLYIDDFLRIIDTIINEDVKNKEFNITPTKSVDLVTIANIINDYSEYKSEIIVNNQGLNYKYTGSNVRLLENMNNDFEFTSYEESIAKLYNYYKDNINNINIETIKKDEALKKCNTR